MTRSTQLKATLRHPCSERGAAVIEGLIVVITTTVCLGCGLWLFRVCDAKLLAVRDARTVAWTKAMQGCQGGGPESRLADSVKQSTKDDSDDDAPLMAPVIDWLMPPVTSQRAKRAARGPANRELVMASQVTVTCNEKQPTEMDWAADTMRDLVRRALTP